MATLDLAGIITRVCTDLKEKIDQSLAKKQDKLVSGNNIKTVNNQNLLGAGNINITFTDTIALKIRVSSASMPAVDTGYRYRIWLTSADGSMFVPINTSTSTNSTTARTLNTRPINPFGTIFYYDNASSVSANTRPTSGYMWLQNTLTIGYSYVISLTSYTPVYLKCTPQSDGSAVMADVVQALPSSNDGKIYIFLGIATSSSSVMELMSNHPVYYHDGTGIRIWTGVPSASGVSF